MPEAQQSNVRGIERDVLGTHAAVVENMFVEQPVEARNRNPKRVGDFRLRKKFLYRSIRILHEVASTPFLVFLGPDDLTLKLPQNVCTSSTLDVESGKLLGRLRT